MGQQQGGMITLAGFRILLFSLLFLQDSFDRGKHQLQQTRKNIPLHLVENSLYLVENEKYGNVVLLIFPVHNLETSSFHTLSSAKSQRTLGKGKLQLFLPCIF